MRKVKFLQDRKVKDAEGKLFREGKIYSMTEASAQHWINRGVAEFADGASEEKKEELKAEVDQGKKGSDKASK